MSQSLRKTIAVALIILPLGGLYSLNYLACNVLFLADYLVSDTPAFSQKSFWIVLCMATGVFSSLLYAHRTFRSKQHCLYCKISMGFVLMLALFFLV